jgi:hypothetical protein
MNTIKGFANYGVLAHEYQVKFTAEGPHYHATASEEVEITLPEGFTAHTNDFGATLIEIPDGTTYTVDEILSSFGDVPVMAWYDGQKNHRVKCEFKEV